jgi:hypothetical protein
LNRFDTPAFCTHAIARSRIHAASYREVTFAVLRRDGIRRVLS